MKIKPTHPGRLIHQNQYKFKENHTGHTVIKLLKTIEEKHFKTEEKHILRIGEQRKEES